MWPRVLELTLGCWLAMSPFIFRYAERPVLPWVSDLGSATWVVVCALLSFNRRRHAVHLLNLIPAMWLLATGYLSRLGLEAAAPQNHIIVALLLGMLAILPSYGDEPPMAWLPYLEREARTRGDQSLQRESSD